jgi:hypothetical protein
MGYYNKILKEFAQSKIPLWQANKMIADWNKEANLNYPLLKRI